MPDRPFWADLHNHNSVGYAAGSLARSYEIARGSLLDVYCFTPHGPWHDMPSDDPKMVDFHRDGYRRVQDGWPDVQAAADQHYQPGQFVTFQGFEWHSSRFGDYHVIFAERGELFAGSSLDELQRFVRQHGSIMIPHHVGYRGGWRGANWPQLAPDVSPLVDVFSEHGCSMEAEFCMPMVLHSMGGTQKSQTVVEQLKRGLVAGLLASTDNHFGHPASYGEGLTGILADQLTRESVFDALRRRHTFAVTGDRIALDLRCGDAMMGDVLPSDAPRELRYRVDACGQIDSIRIIKNGRIALNAPPPGPRDDIAREDTFVVRLSFGWDAMTSEEVTDWKITVDLADGQIVDVLPCFAGGAGSVEKVNKVESVAPQRIVLSAYTSRLNSKPISEIVLRIAGDAATRISVDVDACYKGESCGCRLAATIGGLVERDEWAAVSKLFSAPKIRLGQLHGGSETRIDGAWTDPDPHDGDWYLLRVQQANGQAAWSSPIWFRA